MPAPILRADDRFHTGLRAAGSRSGRRRFCLGRRHGAGGSAGGRRPVPDLRPDRSRFRRHGAVRTGRLRADRRPDDDGDLVEFGELDADRPAALHLDGEDPVPDPPVRGSVQGAGALDEPAAGAAAPCEHHRLHHLCRDLRLVGGHGGDGRQDVDPGIAVAKISGRPGDRHAFRRRDAWPRSRRPSASTSSSCRG